MSAKASTASNVIKLDAIRRRGAKIVDAAQVIAIDYHSIVADAIAGLAHNTPDARREIYAQARRVVRRHLTLMRLPEPIIELEQLSLDLTIRRIEREWRVRQATDAVAYDMASTPGMRGAEQSTPPAARRGVASPHTRPLAQPLATLGVALLAPLRPLRRALLSSVGLMVAVPVVLIAIILVFVVDNRTAYQTLADSAPVRWLSQVDWSKVTPWGHRTEPAQQTARGGNGARDVAGSAPATRPAQPIADSLPYRGATPIRPIRADLSSLTSAAAVPPGAPAPATATMLAATPLDVPAPTSPPAPVQALAPSPCGDIPQPSEHISCAMEEYAKTGLGPKSHARWFRGYAAINDAAAPHPVVQTVGSTTWLPPAGAAAADKGQPPAAVARTTNAKVAALVESGRKWSTRGDLDRAMHDFTEAIRLDPKYPDSYHERGLVLFKMGETDRAIADYSGAIQRDPQFGAALRSRGMAYLYRGTSDRALADLTRAIDLAESDPSTLAPIELFYAHRSRAQIYNAMQQYDREIADCTAAIDSYGRNPGLAEELRQNYTEVGAANVIATVYRQRATAYNRQANWQAAIDDLTAAVPLSYDHGYAALMDRSKLHEGLGQREAAIADVQAALAVRPGSEEARIALRRLGVLPKPTMPVGAL